MMNKTMMFLGVLAVGMANAQQGRVGINTESPNATLDVKERLGNNGLPVDAHIQGVSFPNFTTVQREKLGEGITQSMKEGTLIYNTTKKCIEMYKGYINSVHTWECLSFGNNGSSSGGGSTDTTSPVQTLVIKPSGFEGNYTSGDTFTNANKVKFTITNNSSTPLNNIDLSNAVQLQNTGGNVSVATGQNTSVTIPVGQSVTLTYNLIGTPEQGTLTATMTYNGQTATQSQNVKPIVSVSFFEFRGTYTSGVRFTDGNVVAFKVVNNSVKSVTVGNITNAVTISNGNAHITARGTNTDAMTLNGGEVSYALYKLTGTPVEGQLTATFTSGGSVSGSTIVNRGNIFSSTQTRSASRTYTRNNCGSGYIGSSVTYTQSATATETSTISQADADRKAREVALQRAKELVNNTYEGQAYANRVGSCTPNSSGGGSGGTTPPDTRTFTQKWYYQGFFRCTTGMARWTGRKHYYETNTIKCSNPGWEPGDGTRAVTPEMRREMYKDVGFLVCGHDGDGEWKLESTKHTFESDFDSKCR